MAGFTTRTSHSAWRTMLALFASATVAAALAFSATGAKAEELLVRYDQSQLLRVPRPVSEIIIGIPTIADITVQSQKLLVVTGKSFGTTNLILLDNEKNVIQEARVIVLRDQSKVVNLQRGANRESYACSPRCNPTVTVGDHKEYFKTAAENAELKIKLSQGGSSGGQGGGQ